MAKSRKKKVKVKRLVGSTAMEIVKEPARPSDPSAAAAVQGGDGMDTSEIVVTDFGKASKNSLVGTVGGRVAKKGPQKRKAVKLQKEKALMKAISLIDKQERRVTKAELKKYGKQELKKMD